MFLEQITKINDHLKNHSPRAGEKLSINLKVYDTGKYRMVIFKITESQLKSAKSLLNRSPLPYETSKIPTTGV